MKNKILVFILISGIIILSAQSDGKENNSTYLPVVFAPDLRPIPVQGIYDSCTSYDPNCINHLDLFASEGFKLVLNYGTYYDLTQSLIAYANRAQSLGMKIIWSTQYVSEMGEDDAFLTKKYPNLAHESGCLENACFIRYVVNLVKDLPATWGYYVADEVDPIEHDRMKYYTDLIQSTDPNHPRLYVVMGSYEMMQYFTFPSFMADLTDIYAPDVYPYGFRIPGDQYTELTGIVADHTRYWSNKVNVKGAMVLQAFNGVRYDCYMLPCTFPTYEQMKAQRDQVIQRFNPEIILWWTFEDILKEGVDWQQHWHDLAAAAFSSLPPNIPQATPNGSICPSGWTCEDIGNPEIEGSQSLNNNVWVIYGAGWDISSERYIRADQFHYVFQRLSADGNISAKITSINNTGDDAKAGIMLRKSFDPTSPYYAVYMTPNSKVRVQYRKAMFDDTGEAAAIDASFPVYVKLSRNGQTFGASTSRDGITWTLIPNSIITMSGLEENLMAGMVITSGHQNILGSAGFEDVSLIPNFSDTPPGECIDR
jgi:hypothetical protein